VDMSEYMERHTVARLVGAPPGYVGYEEGGQLTERVRRRPFSVLLLDEIEKAHSDVHNILLQVFDDGRLTDGKGRVVDFTNTLIIATSNVGADVIARRLRHEGEDAPDPAKAREELMETLRMHFRPEFINRLDEIIVFHSLNRDQIRQIVELNLERVRRTSHAQGVDLEVDASLIDYLASEGYRPEFGARELKRLIRSTLETGLARAMLADEVHDGDRVRARWDATARRLVLEPVGRGETPAPRASRRAAKPPSEPADTASRSKPPEGPNGAQPSA
jgi:ATP-dependent Clp protease ATP-binding subunit ClpC